MSKKATVTSRVEDFVNAYVEGILTGKPNATAAAIKAGYSPKSAHQYAFKLLQKPEVKDYLAMIAMERARRADIDGDKIIREINSIAFSPIIPGFVSAADKNKALFNLGVHHKLWEGSKGNKVLVFNVLPQDEKTL